MNTTTPGNVMVVEPVGTATASGATPPVLPPTYEHDCADDVRKADCVAAAKMSIGVSHSCGTGVSVPVGVAVVAQTNDAAAAKSAAESNEAAIAPC